MSTDLAYLPATRMAELVRAREISPVELVRAHLARIERFNPVLKAFVTVTADTALQQARAAEQAVMSGAALGPMHGVPCSIKDSIDVCGVRTQTGSRIRAGVAPPGRDSAVVERLREAGAIVLGKTNTPEMLVAYETDNLVTGATANPWDLSRTAGGSSGGESSAIAAGLSPGGIGSDAGGSVRVPAHFCGICALKPTPGRISGRGHFPGVAGPFATTGMLGPMARTVDDLALITRIVSRYDPEDPVGAPLQWGARPRPSLGGAHVGLWRGDAHTPLCPDTERVLARSAQLLRDSGFVVEEFPAEPMERAHELWWNFFGRAARPLFEGFAEGHEGEISPILREFLAYARESPPFSLLDFLNTTFERDGLRGWLARQMQNTPLLLTPVGSIAAFRHGEREWDVDGRRLRMWDIMRPCCAFNLLGNPAVVIPAGSRRDGLPLGVQLVGRPFEEEFLLSAAARLERARGPWQQPPVATMGNAIGGSER